MCSGQQCHKRYSKCDHESLSGLVFFHHWCCQSKQSVEKGLCTGSCLVRALAGWLAYVNAALKTPPLVPAFCCQADHTLLASGLHRGGVLSSP